MNQRFPVLTGAGSEILPTANATLFTADMNTADAQNATQVYVEFYSDALGTIPVTPTAGTVTVWGSPLGNNYMSAGNIGVITATDVAAPVSNYTPPFFSGKIAKGRITFDSISGAAYARVIFWRYS